MFEICERLDLGGYGELRRHTETVMAMDGKKRAMMDFESFYNFPWVCFDEEELKTAFILMVIKMKKNKGNLKN